MNEWTRTQKWVAGVLGTLSPLVVIVGAVWAAQGHLDERHVTRTEFQYVQSSYDELTYTSLKREIRELRELIRHAGDESAEWVEQLELDLQDAIDRLCRSYPDDRECQ